MADNREIWKIDNFQGGLNNATDVKDLKTNEFAELVDIKIASRGSMTALGHAESDITSITETIIDNDILYAIL